MTANIQQTTNRIDQRQIDQETRELLSWITPIDHIAQQADIAKRRQKGTGQWLIDSAEFQKWVNGKSATLFCPGIPGAGKTMMASNVIDYVESRFRVPATSSKPVGVAYIFCTFQHRAQQNLDDLLASLLKQLVRQLAAIPESLQSMLSNFKYTGRPLTVDNIIQLLGMVFEEFSRSFILVDALDECQSSYQTVAELLANIFSLQTRHEVNLFATSRKIPEIASKFNHCPTIDIHASQEDIRMYLTGHMAELPSFVSEDPQLQTDIVTGICSSIDGM